MLCRAAVNPLLFMSSTNGSFCIALAWPCPCPWDRALPPPLTPGTEELEPGERTELTEDVPPPPPPPPPGTLDIASTSPLTALLANKPAFGWPRSCAPTDCCCWLTLPPPVKRGECASTGPTVISARMKDRNGRSPFSSRTTLPSTWTRTASRSTAPKSFANCISCTTRNRAACWWKRNRKCADQFSRMASHCSMATCTRTAGGKMGTWLERESCYVTVRRARQRANEQALTRSFRLSSLPTNQASNSPRWNHLEG